MNRPIFNIDFNTWKLLKNPESGVLEEPVPKKEFDHFEYWSDAFNQPVRQIISKNNSSHYADYLDLETATLSRRVSSLLGWSPYDNEIDKNQYEELCQLVLLKHRFKKLVNLDILIPFQTITLRFYDWDARLLIGKTKKLYGFNFKKLMLEETNVSKEEMVNAKSISEYEYYYGIFNILIKSFDLNIS